MNSGVGKFAVYPFGLHQFKCRDCFPEGGYFVLVSRCHDFAPKGNVRAVFSIVKAEPGKLEFVCNISLQC